MGRKLSALACVTSLQAEVIPPLGWGREIMRHATSALKVNLYQFYFSPDLFISYSVSINGEEEIK